MADAIFCLFGAYREAELRWPHIQTHITSMFDKPTSPSLTRVIILTLPYIGRNVYTDPTTVASRWIAAASAVPYSEVDQNMTQALLMVSYDDDMRPHIPVNVWAWLNKRLSLPPISRGRSNASQRPVFCHIRILGDIEILKSYLLLVWSEWGSHEDDCLVEMEMSIKKDLCGIGMRGHRDDLIKRLDFIHGELDRGLDHFRQYQPRTDQQEIQSRKEGYGLLKDVLLAVDKTTGETSTRRLSRFIFLDQLTDPCVSRISGNPCLCPVSPISVVSSVFCTSLCFSLDLFDPQHIWQHLPAPFSPLSSHAAWFWRTWDSSSSVSGLFLVFFFFCL